MSTLSSVKHVLRQRTKIQVRGAESIERRLESPGGVPVFFVREFGGQEDLFAGYARVPDTLSDLFLVGVRCGSVDVPVPELEGDLYGFLDLTGLRLPGAYNSHSKNISRR